MTRRVGNAAGCLFAAAVVALSASGGASAATFKVTGTGDPVPNGCKKKDCSLREAVRDANETANADRIVLGAKRYGLVQAGDDENALAGDLDISEAGSKISIVGKGPNRTRIDASQIDRVFDLDYSRLALKGVTVEGGQTNLDGGGVYMSGDGASLTATNVVFERNEGAGGGAIYAQNQSDVEVSRSTFDRNSGLQRGGAIFAQNESSVDVENSTFVGNRLQSMGEGGAVYARNDAGVDIENSTFGDNMGFVGGAIYADDQATFEIRFTTITRSSSVTAAVHDGTTGGLPANPTFELRGVLIADNGTSGNCEFPDSNPIVSNGANVEDADSCRFNTGTDRVNANAALSRLAANGGPTKTHALKKSSDAIGAASPGSCPDRDQRGVRRPQGSGCDSGAYERER